MALAPTIEFDQFYREQRDHVYSFLRRYLGDRDDAEDAFVETFRRASRSLPDIRDPGAHRAWVMRIATNVAHRAREGRIKRRALSLEVLCAEGLEIRQAGDSVEEEVVRKRLVDELLADLPDRQRMAVWLRVGEQHTDQEVAEILGVPVGTVKSWVWRSLVRLRNALPQEVLP